MDCSFIPLLEFMALVKVTTILWNQPDIRNKIFWFPLYSSDKLQQWKEVENLVVSKVSRLSLPSALRRCVLGSVKPIGEQIFRWLKCHKNLYLGILHLPNELHWSMQGILDYKKTAEALIQDRSLHIFTRYKLSCIYCLQNDILELWNEIPEYLQKLFSNRLGYSREFEHLQFVISLWTHEIERQSLALCNVTEIRKIRHIEWRQPTTDTCQRAFERSVYFGNKAATEFFFQKLTLREREESLLWCTKHVAHCRPSTNVLDKYSNVLCSLISKIDDEQKLQIYTRYTCTMLKCLLDWPRQSFFDETADRVGRFLDVYDYNYLLNQIVVKLIAGFQDWNYKQLFVRFWRKGTISQKRYVLDECICGPLLTNLFNIKDMENISLLFHDATVAEKEEIVYYRKDVIVALIYNDEWKLLKMLVEHNLSSGDIVGNFQKEFLERDLSSLAKEDMVEEKAILKRFLKVLNKLIHIPHYGDLRKIQWHKEETKYDVWRSLKIRQTLLREGTAIQQIEHLSE